MAFGSTTVTIIDDDEPGEIGIKDKDAEVSVLEAEGKAVVFISRMNGSAGPIGCSYKCVPGTAVDGTNFKAVSGELTFEAGQIAKKVRTEGWSSLSEKTIGGMVIGMS